jgi:hypothetical protein
MLIGAHHRQKMQVFTQHLLPDLCLNNDNQSDLISAPEYALIQEMRKLARKKMSLDFKCSLLSSPKIVESALEKSWKKLEVAKLLDATRIEFEALNIASATWSGICSDESLRLLKNHDEIVIECANISVGAIAVVKSLQKRLGINIQLKGDVQLFQASQISPSN